MALDRHGYVVVPDFLDTVACASLVREIEEDRAAGALRPATVGRGARRGVRPEVRADEIRWLDPAALTPALAPVWQRLDDLRRGLNRTSYLGLRWFESHLAVYPEGGGYEKHVDRFRADGSPGADARSVSFVLYLNDDWQDSDGGELRLYDRDSPGVVAAEVSPRGGTLVYFLSAEIPHEVLPPRRPRYSLTGWYRTDTPP